MISNEEFKKLQKLAQLDFSDNEIENLSQKLASVMGIINELQEVDAEGIKPLRSVCDMHQRFRKDDVKMSNTPQDIFQNLPEKGAEIAKEVKCFIVPKVIE